MDVIIFLTNVYVLIVYYPPVLAAWYSFVLVVQNFLGPNKSENYVDLKEWDTR